MREKGVVITIPKPQSYHNYCQVCMCIYENFEEHVTGESHLIRAKNQVYLTKIDDIINQLNCDEPWIHNWKPEAPKVKPTGRKMFQYKITKEGKIKEIYTTPDNVASRKTFMTHHNGRKSGRASAAGIPAGKASKTSKFRSSAKSSVTRSMLN